MKTYSVNNTSPLAKAFKVHGGFQVVAAGTKAEVANARPLTEAQIDAFARDGVRVAEKAEKPAKVEKEGLKAEHHGGGKFNITRGEEVLASGLSKADADAFNGMSDEDKAAFVADKK